jgi:hypothetical protein
VVLVIVGSSQAQGGSQTKSVAGTSINKNKNAKGMLSKIHGTFRYNLHFGCPWLGGHVVLAVKKLAHKNKAHHVCKFQH